MVLPAKPDDAPTLTAIALIAKRHWGYPAAWMAEWEPGLRVTPEFIAANETFAAWSDDGEAEKVLGWAALVVADNGEAWLEHLWVQPEAMGRGVGRFLFDYAVARARGAGLRAPAHRVRSPRRAFLPSNGAHGARAPRHLPCRAFHDSCLSLSTRSDLCCRGGSVREVPQSGMPPLISSLGGRWARHPAAALREGSYRRHPALRDFADRAASTMSPWRPRSLVARWTEDLPQLFPSTGLGSVGA